MWAKTFEARLAEWQRLRDQVAAVDIPVALHLVNSWWFRAPWCPYHLHWDDRDTWPDPWQLLSDNVYCDLARGLGIMYTISLLEREDLQDACLAECDGYNLVLVNQKKYILNWKADTIVNITLEQVHARNQISQEQIKQKIG